VIENPRTGEQIEFEVRTPVECPQVSDGVEDGSFLIRV
jgi:hypothetical protein